MAVLTLNFESHYLHSNTDVTIIVPDRRRDEQPRAFFTSGKRYPVLWLLHGTYGDHSDWLRKTRIELYAAERECIVVMPSGINTYFSNWPGFGPGYYVEDFLIDELMPMVQSWLPASQHREDNFIAGLSMGGASAAQLFARHPDMFAGAILLSGFPESPDVLRPLAEAALSRDYRELADGARSAMTPFDPDFRAFRIANLVRNAGSIDAYISHDSWNDFLQLADHCNAEPKKVPQLYIACGTEDPNYGKFCMLREVMQQKGLSAIFEEGSGTHDWRFWDEYIDRAMNALLIRYQG